MIEVRIPKEIMAYKEKLFMGLNIRQSVAFVLALAICVPLYLKGRAYISEDTLSWLILLIATPILALGFYTYNGLTAEQVFIVWVKMEFNPQRRLYKQESIYDQIRKDVINEENRESKKGKLSISKGKGQRKTSRGKAKESQKDKGQSS